MARRILNALIACVLLLLTGPLLTLVCLAVWWETPGPILVRQVSVNRHGRRCELLTFRTTAYDHRRSPWDLEVTRVGQMLRYTRIEVLPQLINVLRGDIDVIDIEVPAWFWLMLVACAEAPAPRGTLF
jgi:lipopolysaccharide/colanic/teichoic acid biosynthesis glycosyltransferase